MIHLGRRGWWYILLSMQNNELRVYPMKCAHFLFSDCIVIISLIIRSFSWTFYPHIQGFFAVVAALV